MVAHGHYDPDASLLIVALEGDSMVIYTQKPWISLDSLDIRLGMDRASMFSKEIS